MSNKKKRLVLLDAHAIIHRAYHALPDFATSSGEPTGALYGLSTMLIKLIGDLQPDYIVACFDLPGPTHRHEAYDTYKSGRVKTDDNLKLQLERAKELFNAWSIPIYSHPGFEADDILGTIVDDLRKDKGTEIIIASGDMDTLQLVRGDDVQVFTLKRGINDTIIYDEKKVEERFGFSPALLPDYKGLRGDPSDNIIGVKGIGEKTATLLITTFGNLESIYKALKKKDDTYKKSGITERQRNLLLENEEEALFSKTLATIRTDAPINFVIPDNWQENLDLEKITDLYNALEFRTMVEKVKHLLSKNGQSINEESGKSEGKEKPDSDAIDETSLRVKELCLALWVLDSNITNPKIEDVFRFTKAKNLSDAEKVIYKELASRGGKEVFEDIERPLLPVVEKMNDAGVAIDKKFLEKLGKDYHKELSSLERKIWKEAGEEFNINSPKALGEIVFKKLGLEGKGQKRTPGGALSTRELELKKLEDKHPIISHILEYRELAKLLSTYIDAIPPQLDTNSRLHSTFQQSGTTTGRISSTNPNLQNIPIRTKLGRAIRHAFIAEEGKGLLALDYSQIELRIAAILSQDEKLLEIFKNGEDIHAGVAARVFGVDQSKVDVGMRSKAKTINFGILYGMGVNALKANLGTTRKEAQEFYNNYFNTFTGLAKYLDEVKASASKLGYTETMFGRRRYFSGFNSPLPYVRAQAERMAINAPMQGTQADIIKIAMKRIDEYIVGNNLDPRVKLVLQVHDELVYEMEKDLVDKCTEVFKEIMESAMPKSKSLGVPIIADHKSGDNWGELK